MVELDPSDLPPELQTTVTITTKKKNFWSGSKLPSMGSMITVFAFVGYRSELELLFR